MGRKKLPDDQRRSNRFQIMLSDDELAQLNQAAAAAHPGNELPGRGYTSTWARDILLAAAKRRLNKKS